MPQATAHLASATLARTSTYEVADGNIYFPSSSLNQEHFQPSNTTTFCPWKGEARYYNIVIGSGGEMVRDAAWYYPEPLERAERLKGMVAFYKSKVKVESEDKQLKNTVTP